MFRNDHHHLGVVNNTHCTAHWDPLPQYTFPFPDPTMTGMTDAVSTWWAAHSDGSILGTVQAGLEGMHAITGLPWWATIAVTTVAVKTTLFPFIVIQAHHGERLGNAWPELKILRGYLRTKLGEVWWCGPTQRREQRLGVLLSLLGGGFHANSDEASRLVMKRKTVLLQASLRSN